MKIKTSTSIINVLSTPNRVAHSLDWRKASGSVLNMRITKNKIELALATHPSFQESVISLPSIQVKRSVVKDKKCIDKGVAKDLYNIIRKYHVCGMVVEWPVKEEGWCGAECGVTLNVLDQLTNENIFHPNRPVCLYDSRSSSAREDVWGRTPIYGRAYSDRADCSRPHQDDENIVTSWNKFRSAQWPDIPLMKEKHRYDKKSFVSSNSGDVSSILARSDRYVSATT
jgi:hypothetical protein